MKDIQKILCAAIALGAVAALAASAPALAASVWEEQPSQVQQAAPKRVHPDEKPVDSAQTTLHWDKAREYQKAQRFELSRQHYLLALSSCRSEETRDRLQRELQIVDLQLRTMR